MSESVVGLAFDGLAYAMLLFIVSVGLSVTMGLLNFINLAHGAFAMLGGYVVAAATNRLGLPFVAALGLACAAVAVLGVVVERLVYRRLYGAGELDQVLLTIGVVFMAVAGTSYVFGPSPQHVRMPGWLSGTVTLAGMPFPAYRAGLIATGLALAAGLSLLFGRTRLGVRIRAVVDNRRMAQSVGIDVDRLFAAVFALGSGLAALGGGLAIDLIGLSPGFAIQYLVFFLIVVVVGGQGGVGGTFLAALVIGMADTAAKYLWPQGGTVFIYALTVALLLIRPRGLLGRA